MPNLIAFSYDDAPLRVELDADGEPLFHAGDLCAILEYANPRDAVRRHCEEDDIVKRDAIDSIGRTQQVNYLRESGMWSLVLGSETAAAKRIKRWVVADVLPSIRKTGSYQLPAQTPEIAELCANVAELRADVALLKKQRSAPKPTPNQIRQNRHDRIRDKVAAYIANHNPYFIGVDWLGEKVLHTRSLTPDDRRAIIAGARQMGYACREGS